MTLAVFRALDAPATETLHHEHECAEHDDVCNDVCEDECCIAAAAEGVE